MSHSLKVNMEGVKVMMAIPGGRNPDWLTVTSILSTMMQLNDMQVPCEPGIIRHCAIVTKARDQLVDQFLSSDCTHMFWLDDDMVWAPDSFVRLLALATQVDVVAAAYPARKDPVTYFAKTENGKTDLEASELGLIEIEGIGLGFCCMARAAVEAVVENKRVVYDQIAQQSIRTVFRTDEFEGNFRGEDMAFFADIREAGFKVWCDPSIELGHLGTKEYRGRLLDVLTVNSNETVKA